MAYNKFTLESAVDKLGLTTIDWPDLFENIGRRNPSKLLEETLDENLVISVSIGTEKARSELVIAPVLLDVRRQADKKISFFSGRKFDIDPTLSLTGTCGFLISKSPNQRLVEAPVVAITEAKKNETLEDGVGQCAAEMFAAIGTR